MPLELTNSKRPYAKHVAHKMHKTQGGQAVPLPLVKDAKCSASPAVLANQIKQEIAAAAGCVRSGLDHARRAGELLNLAKGQLKHGTWEHWVQENCGINKRTAQAYMRIANHWSDIKAQAGLDLLADMTINSALESVAKPRPHPATDSGPGSAPASMPLKLASQDEDGDASNRWNSLSASNSGDQGQEDVGTDGSRAPWAVEEPSDQDGLDEAMATLGDRLSRVMADRDHGDTAYTTNLANRLDELGQRLHNAAAMLRANAPAGLAGASERRAS